MIAIIDYGMGNIHSVNKALQLLGGRTKITNDPKEITQADKAVLPGVGAFDDAVLELEKQGLIKVIKDFVKSGKPLLGICLGMQLLFEESEEAKSTKGLGLIKGSVKRFSHMDNLKVPHMGWNQIKVTCCLSPVAGQCPLFNGITDDSYVYFCHSYYPVPADPVVTVATCDYGQEFAAAVAQDNLYGVQFHPEKSQKTGLKILEGFCEIMLIIPAIDLKDGCVVRYVQGARDKKIYSKDPLKTAKHWVKQGAQLLHLVDLDGAFTGEPKNIDIVKTIAQSISIPVEFGGGVRKLETIDSLLDAGVKRVVLGTKAVSDEKFLQKAYKEFKEKIIVSIDAKGGIVMTEGWKSEGKKMDELKFAAYLKDLGFKQVIYTDTLKDGTLSGPNIKGAKDFLKKTGLKIIVSGGISSLEDIAKIKKIEKSGAIGVIIGKALYEGKFTLSQAIKL